MSNSRFRLNRRDVLKGLGAGLGLAGAGCLGDGTGPNFRLSPPSSCAPAPQTWDSARNRIESVVVLCMENRSFDHYFGAMSLPQSMGGLGMTHVNGLLGNEAQRSPMGGDLVGVHKLLDFTPHDLPHEWEDMHDMFNGGQMDGFVRAAESWAKRKVDSLQKKAPIKLPADELAAVMAREAMGYHTPDQIPMFYQLAEQSALCENWFSSVMGPTWTNRFYLHGSTAEGLKNNLQLGSVLPLVDLAFGWESILDVMEGRNGFEAMNFYHDLCWLRSANPDVGREFRRQFQRVVHKKDHKKPRGFFARARANQLPPLSIIDPHFGIFRGEDANDDHPDPGGRDLHDVRKGQALIATVVKALAQNPDQWNRTLLVITYDESGGFYDHVAPPRTFDERAEFGQLGFRVPSLVIGPYTRQGCAVDTQLEHASIIKTIEQLFGQERAAGGFHFRKRFKDKNVLRRIDASNDLLSCLDADALEGRPHPAPHLDPVPISLSKWKALPKEGFHDELRQLAYELPEHIRKEAHDPILDEVMAIGQELGAVRLKA